MPSNEVVVTQALEEIVTNYQSPVTDVQKAIQADNRLLIDGWRDVQIHSKNQKFGTLYDSTISALGNDEISRNALSNELSQSSLQIVMADMTGRYTNSDPVREPDRTSEQLAVQKREFVAKRAITGFLLLLELTSKQNEKIAGDEVFVRAKDGLSRIQKQTVFKVEKTLEKEPALVGKPATKAILQLLTDGELADSDAQDFMTFLRKIISEKRSEFIKAEGAHPSQFMGKIFQEVRDYCTAHSLENPIMDLTLGDVASSNMPDYLREALGLDPLGPKSLNIATYAQSEISRYKQSGYDPIRYDVKSLGIQDLRNQFVGMGKTWGLYGEDEVIDDKASMLGEGGLGIFNRVFSAADKYVKAKVFTESQRTGKESVTAYFPNPGFRMVTNTASGTGVQIVEKTTDWKDNYLPDPDDVEKYLIENKNCKIFVLTPINNPGSTVADADKISRLLDVLKKNNMLLITDLAYLGTGDMESNRALMKVINNYKQRIDIYSMSKIFGRPGLRLGCAVTPDRNVAIITENGKPEIDNFISAAQNHQIGISYPALFEALAIWKYVKQDHRTLLAKHYQDQQVKLKTYLESIDRKRSSRGLPSLKRADREILGDAALYLVYPLNNITLAEANGKSYTVPPEEAEQMLDAFELIAQALIVGTPFPGFYGKVVTNSEDINQVRLSVGVATIPKIS